VQRMLPRGNILCTVHNSYNRTETIGSETQSDFLMMGVKTPETC